MKIRRWLGAMFAALVASEISFAAEEIPESMKACVAMRRDSERLACYDHAVENIRTGKKDAAPSAENMFGAGGSVTRGVPPEKERERQELRQITGRVTSLRRVEDGMIQLELDNGQVWRQTDTDRSLSIEPGDTVTIVRASLGTFRVADKRGRSARVKRVR